MGSGLVQVLAGSGRIGSFKLSLSLGLGFGLGYWVGSFKLDPTVCVYGWPKDRGADPG